MQNSIHYMIVDDDEDDRNLLIEIFREMAPEKMITIAENGFHLMEQLNLLEPDVILLDLNMPGKNGIECLKDLKLENSYAHIPVLIYSTSADPAHIKTTYENGANLYIQKPVSLVGMRKMVKRLLTLHIDEILPQPPYSNFIFR